MSHYFIDWGLTKPRGFFTCCMNIMDTVSGKNVHTKQPKMGRHVEGFARQLYAEHKKRHQHSHVREHWYD